MIDVEDIPDDTDPNEVIYELTHSWKHLHTPIKGYIDLLFHFSELDDTAKAALNNILDAANGFDVLMNKAARYSRRKFDSTS